MAFKEIKFSLVSTVFNEAARLGDWIEGIESQTVLPDEVIITDAGSTDGTLEALSDWGERSSLPIQILVSEKCNVAEGRNIAIKVAQYDLIVSTDFGCRYHPEWLRSIIEPFCLHDNIEVVGGAFTVDEKTVDTMSAKADWILQGGYRTTLNRDSVVSSRSIAYKKYVWEQIGGYPEWLTLAADDLIFWKAIRKNNYNYEMVNKPYVYWGRHETQKQFANEAYRYGLGDGESRVNFRNFWSNLIETGMRYFFFFWVILLPVLYVRFGIVSFVGVLFILGLRSYSSAFVKWRQLHSPKYNVSVFIKALVQIEMSRWRYMSGYIKGCFDSDPEKVKGRAQLNI